MRAQRIAVAVPRAGLTGVLLAAALVVAGCGGSSSSTTRTRSAGAVKLDAAGTLTPVAAAPALELRNYLGERVNIASYRGKAVLVTFIYTHCPDVCPLITSNLRVAQNLMGPARAARTQIIAVSVDPRGDTRRTVSAFLAAHEMTGRMQYLVGSARELATVWKAWGVGSERDAKDPELVEHSGLVYGITGSGERLAIYAANFRPSDIVHDVPLLAAR
ncbi:MAG TPA: SCO family protein [Solirubrobacteraceae bacterium]|jgi:protein SCO1/2